VGVLPDFGGLLPEPTEANLGSLKSAVTGEGADIGVALDGDADRFGVVDSRGVYLSPNKALTIILWYLLRHRPGEGGVARSLATTHMLDTIAVSAGREVSETPVGFKYVGELMRKGSILLGGEESGGMSVAGHVPEKDGLVAGLLLVEITSKLGKPLSAVLEDIYGEFGPCFDERIDIPLAEEEKRALIESLKKNPPGEIAGEPVVRTDLRDGVKLVTERDTWVLIRPSGTEPLVRAYVEARSAQAFDKARGWAINIVRGKSG
jgi:phosphomannomutase